MKEAYPQRGRMYPLKVTGIFMGGICENSVRKLIQKGILDARKIGRTTRVTGESIIDAPNKLPRIGAQDPA